MSLQIVLEHISTQAPSDAAFSHFLRMSRRNIRLEFATEIISERLGKSMRHLRQSFNGAPDLVISCWTRDEQNGFKPPSDWPSDGVLFFDENPICVSWEPNEGTLIAYDRSKRCAWVEFASEDSITGWEQATPFRKPLHWWATDLGLQLVHAACVGGSSGALLLVGKGGSGKSTTALACLDKCLGYAGDDYCLLEFDSMPMVQSLYVSAKGDAKSATLLSGLRDSFIRSQLRVHDKSVIFADEERPEAIVTRCPLQAIVVPQIIGGSTCKLKRLSAIDSLRAIAPSTLFQLPGQKSVSFNKLSYLVRQIPSWSLQLGSDPYEAVDLLVDLLRRNPAR